MERHPERRRRRRRTVGLITDCVYGVLVLAGRHSLNYYYYYRERLASPSTTTTITITTTITPVHQRPVAVSVNAVRPSVRAADATMPERRPFVRLPADVFPVNYGLCLKPDLKNFTFEGKLEAAVEVTQATNQIVMNCADIDIITASFVPEGGEGEEINATGFNYQNEDEKVTLSFPSTLQKGATDARRAFPCWDEPAIKATFDIMLVVPKDRVALSNMNVVDRKPHAQDADLVEVKFATTAIMSTYLVAFVIGEYDFVEAQSSDGVLVRVYTPVGKAEQGNFALEVATKTLPFYKDYFNVPYPLPKIDLIAIADFAAGAMENWGLVTYRETALLIDPRNSCSSSRQWVALVVGHELAHQWFGNLVTMEWWTHLWLNEGFASWIEYLCVDHCFPEYDIWTHKGASVIRMLHDYIGDEDFRKGMNAYLLKFQHKNASTEDLWDCLEQASGKPIAAVMSSWTQQMGFPIIVVDQEQQGDDRIIKLSQKKFCASGPHTAKECPSWMVPVSICSSDDPTCARHKVLLDGTDATITLSNVRPDQWVKSRAGMINTVEVLRLMEAFVNEPNYTVWSDLSCNLGVLSSLLSHTDFHEEIQEFIRDLFTPIGLQLGWDSSTGEGHLEALLRGLVLGKLGKAGHKATLDEARRRFKEHVEGRVVLSADLRSPVYLTVLKHGDSTTLDTMLKLHKQADMQEERNRIERVLGAISAPDLIQKVLVFALSDTVSVIGGVAEGSKQGRKAAWKFVKDNWEELHNRYQGGFLISRLIKLSVDGFATDKMAAEVKNFFESHHAPAAERTVQQCCENILLNAAWLKRDADHIHQYLLQRRTPRPLSETAPPPV
ncbi:hypothetical protein CRUP_001065 [Coryphaenoides rupestris]|nr:hypothetical protein CRUP_001065 [Coryphaenoides rupestris]